MVAMKEEKDHDGEAMYVNCFYSAGHNSQIVCTMRTSKSKSEAYCINKLQGQSSLLSCL